MSNLMGFPEALTLPNRRGVASFRKGCAWAGGHMLLARSSSRFAVSVLVGRPIGDIPDTIFDSRSRRRPSSGGTADRYGTVFDGFTQLFEAPNHKTPGHGKPNLLRGAEIVP